MAGGAPPLPAEPQHQVCRTQLGERDGFDPLITRITRKLEVSEGSHTLTVRAIADRQDGVGNGEFAFIGFFNFVSFVWFDAL